MKRIGTIKKALEKKGYTVIERDNTLVLAQELQEDVIYSEELGFKYAPTVYEYGYDSSPSSEISEIVGDGWFWECEYPTCFKLYKD